MRQTRDGEKVFRSLPDVSEGASRQTDAEGTERKRSGADVRPRPHTTNGLLTTVTNCSFPTASVVRRRLSPVLSLLCRHSSTSSHPVRGKERVCVISSKRNFSPRCTKTECIAEVWLANYSGLIYRLHSVADASFTFLTSRSIFYNGTDKLQRCGTRNTTLFFIRFLLNFLPLFCFILPCVPFFITSR